MADSSPSSKEIQGPDAAPSSMSAEHKVSRDVRSQVDVSLSRESIDSSLADAAVYDVDISEGWDTQSQGEILIDALKRLPFYRDDLVYSGFNGDQIGTSVSGSEPGIVYCSPENELIRDDEEGDLNPLRYANDHERGAIAVYDPKKLDFQEIDSGASDVYKIVDPSALLGIIRLK